MYTEQEKEDGRRRLARLNAWLLDHNIGTPDPIETVIAYAFGLFAGVVLLAYWSIKYQ